MLGAEEAASRTSAAQALGWIGSASATDALTAALADEQEIVRGQVAWALGEIGDPGAQRELAHLQASDPSSSVREAAGFALARLGTHSDGRALGWSAWIQTLSRFEVARWLLLILVLLAGGLLVARNLQPTPAPADCRKQR
jgi:hypothetical protein